MQLEELLERRVKREPMAYIVGEKEFYDRTFAVTPDVLIPRPESEAIVDLLKKIIELRPPVGGSNLEVRKRGLQIVDIGTGSGCLAVTAKLEWPETKVIAIDTSKEALRVAKKNARMHKADVSFLSGSLLEPIQNSKFDPPTGGQNSILIANLPYVDTNWDVSPETTYEPVRALFTSDGGLLLIKKLIRQAAAKLTISDSLLLEADPRQHEKIITFAHNKGLEFTIKDGFILQFTKV